LGSVRGRFGVGSGSVWGRFGVGSGYVWGRFGVYSGSLVLLMLAFAFDSHGYSVITKSL